MIVVLLIFHENESGIAFWQDNGWELRQDIYVMSKFISIDDRSN
ncbi:MAG: acetyltransferase [Chloroflexi bacterium]|nr:acetyltransferase [Chloroflexota bacterium]